VNEDLIMVVRECIREHNEQRDGQGRVYGWTDDEITRMIQKIQDRL
jgi:hypothetical protein